MNVKVRRMFSEREKELYVNLLRLCSPPITVLAKVKLSEFLTPDAEYGTDIFYHDFMELNNITVPFLLWDGVSDNVKAVVVLREEGRESPMLSANEWLKRCQIPLVEIGSFAELYTNGLIVNHAL